jgi:hypothetical protein
MARLTLNIPTKDITPMRAMKMVVTSMAIGTMAETRETTPMEITVEAMDTIMEAMETTIEAMETIMEEMEIRMDAMAIRMEEMGSTL